MTTINTESYTIFTILHEFQSTLLLANLPPIKIIVESSRAYAQTAVLDEVEASALPVGPSAMRGCDFGAESNVPPSLVPTGQAPDTLYCPEQDDVS